MATKKRKTKESEVTVMVSVRFPPDLKKRLVVASAHHGITVQELLRKGALMALGDL